MNRLRLIMKLNADIIQKLRSCMVKKFKGWGPTSEELPRLSVQIGIRNR